MSHPTSLIAEVLDGKQLSSEDDAALLRHLAECEACRKAWDDGVRLLRAARGGGEAAAPGELSRMTRRAVAIARSPAAEAEASPETRRWWLLAPLAAAAVLLVLLWPAQRAVIGRVLVAGAGLEIDGQKAVADQPVLEGAVVTSRDGDSALIIDADRGVLLRKGAVMALPGAAEATVLAGRARFAVKPGHGPFAVRSGPVRVEVVGTIFVVDRKGADETLVAVHRGTVNVSDPHGTVQVKDGQECLATATALSPARPAGPSALEEDRGGNWLAELFARLTTLVEAVRQAIGE